MMVFGIAGVGAAAVLAAWWWHRRALDRERARRRELESVLDGLSSGLLVTGADGAILRCNPAAARLLGWQCPPPPGTRLAVAAGEGLAPLVDLTAAVLLSGREARRCEIEAVRPDGTAFPLGISAVPLAGPDGPAAVVSVFQDLTEVHRLRERMREQDRLATIGELAAALAHEIRNPLGSIRGSAELLVGSAPVSAEDRQLLELILRESERVNRLMEDFLHYARHRPPAHLPLPLAELLDEVAAALAVRDDLPAGWELRRDVPEDLTLHADRDQVRQVLENLLVNAVQAAPGRPVTVTAREAGEGMCRLEVRDEGPGVPPEERERIFRPFVTSKPAGTGLGLAIARRIARAHGGDLVCAGEPGEGGVFHLVLPTAAAAPEREPAARPAPLAVP